jgi:alginate O-acetyltransferase complex protein AlgI
MVFSSILFLFRFLPIALLLYFAAPGKWKNLVLFVLSLFFYAWGEPVYVGLMLFSTVVDYVHGRLVEKLKSENKNRKAKMVVASSVIINLALLCFFKYADFLIANVNTLLGVSVKQLNLALPIGISFYTFQTMSYTIDVYRGDAKAQKNIVSFGTYVALFPQLIAGPIVRYKTVSEQMENRRTSVEGFSYGVYRFVTGLGKKVLLANNIGLLWEEMSALGSEGTVLSAWIGMIAYAFQIYFDFSGYSDMAIGLGAMFGFHFDENFNYPYQSKSITEFWRRWHISLGTWFREYVYIPLGGNKKGKAVWLRNLLIVWALTGIWHGASWNFMAWGLYFGILLILEKLFLLKVLKKLPAVFGHIYTLVLVLFSWALFAFDDISRGIAYIGRMAGLGAAGFADSHALYALCSYGILLIVMLLGSTEYPKILAGWLYERFAGAGAVQTILRNVFLAAVFVLSVAYIVDASYNPFLYFRF